MKSLFIAFLAMASISAGAAENPAKQIKRQMCFETYPRTTFNDGVQHDWTINEVIETPGIYKTYKLVTANKVKTDGMVLFDFSGISHQYGKLVNVDGSAFYSDGDGWTLNVNASTKLGAAGSIDNQPYVTSLATWDMYANIGDPGTGGNFVKFEATAITPANADFYEISVVRAIDCKDFDRTAPVLN